MNTTRHFFPDGEAKAELPQYGRVDRVRVDNRIRPLAAFRNLFSRSSYHIDRFVSHAFEARLRSLLQEQEYDVIQLETLYLAPYIGTIRQYSKAVVCMRAHNVEQEIWQRITNNTGVGPKRWYLQHLTSKLARFEDQQLKHYDLLAAITLRDLKAYRNAGFTGKGVTIPIGLDVSQYCPDWSSYDGQLSLSFIGSLDWMPNLEGLNWLLQDIWPTLIEDYPDLRLQVAGRNTPDWLLQAAFPCVAVVGEVPDACTFINQHSIMLVPLLSGSGMRAKILEGMALGKVVLTTRIGLEGIAAKDRVEVLVADSLAEFKAQLRFARQHPQELKKIGQQARRLVEQHYDTLTVARRLLQAYESLTVEAS